jgi:hypothetical protein
MANGPDAIVKEPFKAVLSGAHYRYRKTLAASTRFLEPSKCLSVLKGYPLCRELEENLRGKGSVVNDPPRRPGPSTRPPSRSESAMSSDRRLSTSTARMNERGRRKATHRLIRDEARHIAALVQV